MGWSDWLFLAAVLRMLWRGVYLHHHIQPEPGAGLWGSFSIHVWRIFLVIPAWCKMEFSFQRTEWKNVQMKECATVYPNCRSISRSPIKLNEGYTAFKCLLKRLFPPCLLRGFDGERHEKEITSTMHVAIDQKKHVVSHQQHMWEHSISVLLQARNLPPCCCLHFLHHSLPTFLIRFPSLK